MTRFLLPWSRVCLVTSSGAVFGASPLTWLSDRDIETSGIRMKFRHVLKRPVKVMEDMSYYNMTVMN